MLYALSFLKMFLCCLSLLFKNISPGSAHVLDDVRLSLEREAMELDNMTVQMNAGTRLLKEKERHLRKMKTRAQNDLHVSKSLVCTLDKIRYHFLSPEEV